MENAAFSPHPTNDKIKKMERDHDQVVDRLRTLAACRLSYALPLLLIAYLVPEGEYWLAGDCVAFGLAGAFFLERAIQYLQHESNDVAFRLETEKNLEYGRQLARFIRYE